MFVYVEQLKSHYLEGWFCYMQFKYFYFFGRDTKVHIYSIPQFLSQCMPISVKNL